MRFPELRAVGHLVNGMLAYSSEAAESALAISVTIFSGSLFAIVRKIEAVDCGAHSPQTLLTACYVEVGVTRIQ